MDHSPSISEHPLEPLPLSYLDHPIEPRFDGKRGLDRQAGIGNAISVLNPGGDKLRLRVLARGLGGLHRLVQQPPAIAPPTDLEQEAAIDRANATVDMAELAIANNRQELTYLAELPSLDPLVLEHEQAKLAELQHNHTVAVREYQLAMGKRSTAEYQLCRGRRRSHPAPAHSDTSRFRLTWLTQAG